MLDEPHMEVSWNGGTPKSSRFSWDFPFFTNHFGESSVPGTPIMAWTPRGFNVWSGGLGEDATRCRFAGARATRRPFHGTRVAKRYLGHPGYLGPVCPHFIFFQDLFSWQSIIPIWICTSIEISIEYMYFHYLFVINIFQISQIQIPNIDQSVYHQSWDADTTTWSPDILGEAMISKG